MVVVVLLYCFREQQPYQNILHLGAAGGGGGGTETGPHILIELHRAGRTAEQFFAVETLHN